MAEFAPTCSAPAFTQGNAAPTSRESHWFSQAGQLLGKLHTTTMTETIKSAALESSTSVKRPLVVDLDGTLLRSDLLIEAAFSALSRSPVSLFGMLSAFIRGKASLKHFLAMRCELDPSVLPYDEVVLASIYRASTEGRPVYLVSGSNRKLVEMIARHLGIFTGWWASDESCNLSGDAKAKWLVAQFGERGFDYIGNDAADLSVWARAHKAITIRISGRVARTLTRNHTNIEHLATDRPNWRTWTRLLRVHQYVKNALVFVPMLTAHQFAIGPMYNAFLAAVAFSLCASSVYILNDLADLQADRTHPSKSRRPLASGAISPWQSICAVPILLALAILIAMTVSLPFLAVLLAYFSLTCAYSFFLKRKMLVDAVTLAMLYVLRVLGGAAATGIVVSEWLMAFSLFIFFSLGLIKRYVELAARLDLSLADPVNRNYKLNDLGIVAALAAAAGFNAVTVFALYISSNTVRDLYRHPDLLWLICPIFLYWISRALMMAHRRLMDHDPIVFALRDKNSLLAAVLIVVLLIAAT
jgi:4-hydroxybenzoate polyprenyltransferase